MKPARLPVSVRAATEVWLWRHGWVWPAVALVALAGVILYVAGLRPQQMRLADLDAQVRHERDAARRQSMATNAAAAPADARAVIAASPPADQLVARMIELAQAEQVALPQAEYQQRTIAGADISQVQITQPLRATYPQVRKYVEAVLRAVPNASLDQLAARRENVGQPQLEARLRWSLWLPRATPAPAASGQEGSAP